MGIERPTVPGYELGRLRGEGSGGAVWDAIRTSDGASVCVKVVRGGGLERAVHRRIDHPHVVRLLAEVDLPGGDEAFVLERVDGASLGRVVRARSHLTAAETSTLLVTLGTTVAELHRAGISHADLSPGNILLQGDGRPMICDFGVAAITGVPTEDAGGTTGFIDPAVVDGRKPGPESDVYALGAIGWFALVGAPPPHPAVRGPLDALRPDLPSPLVAVIEGALAPAPADRPSADEVASAVYDACRPGPIAVEGGGDGDVAAELTRRIRALASGDGAAGREAPRERRTRRPPGRRRANGSRVPARRLPRRLLPVGVCAAGLGLSLAAAGVLRGGPTAASSAPPPSMTATRSTGTVSARLTPTATPTPTPTPTPTAKAMATPWAGIVSTLADARVRAFADPARGPGAVDAPGSSAWSDDAAELLQLARDHLHYDGLTITTGEVTVVAHDGDHAQVQTQVRRSAYDVMAVDGTVRGHLPPSAPRTVVLRLRRTPAGWRVAGTG